MTNPDPGAFGRRATGVAGSFVNQLRTPRGAALVMGPPVPGPVLRLRVQLAALWDAVRVDAAGSESVRAVKLNALHLLSPGALFPDDFQVKLGGLEILDESVTLADAGVRDGSVLLVSHRHRRPVRN